MTIGLSFKNGEKVTEIICLILGIFRLHPEEAIFGILFIHKKGAMTKMCHSSFLTISLRLK